MLLVEQDNSIYLTRGDAATIVVEATGDGNEYTFQAGDVLRLKVFAAKKPREVYLEKTVSVQENTRAVEFELSGDDTDFGDLISKPKKYWYEVELNPDTYPQTIIGYDGDGEKNFWLYPEGGMLNE